MKLCKSCRRASPRQPTLLRGLWKEFRFSILPRGAREQKVRRGVRYVRVPRA